MNSREQRYRTRKILFAMSGVALLAVGTTVLVPWLMLGPLRPPEETGEAGPDVVPKLLSDVLSALPVHERASIAQDDILGLGEVAALSLALEASRASLTDFAYTLRSTQRTSRHPGMVTAGRHAMPALRKALREGDRETRRAALGVIPWLGPAAHSALPELLSILPDDWLTADAEAALAELGPVVEPELLRLAADLRAGIRSSAARILRLYESPRYVRARDPLLAAEGLLVLLRLTGDAEAMVRHEACVSLQRLLEDAWMVHSPIFPDRDEAQRCRVLDDFAPHVARCLTDVVWSQSPRDRRDIAGVLGVTTPTPLMTEALGHLLFDGEAEVRVSAASALTYLGGYAPPYDLWQHELRRVEPLLEAALSDPHGSVRLDSLFFFSHATYGAVAFDAALECVMDPEESIRETARTILRDRYWSLPEAAAARLADWFQAAPVPARLSVLSLVADRFPLDLRLFYRALVDAVNLPDTESRAETFRWLRRWCEGQPSRTFAEPEELGES